MTTVQENVGVTVAYKVESTLGTLPGTTGAKYLRRVSSNLSVGKDAFTSAEVRPDQQVSDARHGVRRVAGTIEGELSHETYDDLIEAVMRGTWASGISKTQTDFTSIAASASGSSLTLGSGDAETLGYRVGDVVVLSNASVAANNGVNFRITSMSVGNTVLGVTPAPTDMTADTSVTMAVRGEKLVMGTTKRSYTFEQRYDAIDMSERFTGCRVGGMNVRIPPNGMATVGFQIVGQNGDLLDTGNSPYFESITAAPNTDILAGPTGSIRVAGIEQAVITGIDFNLNLNMTSQPVVGSNVVPDIFYGRSVITGNLSAYLDDDALVDAFLNETEIDIVVQLESGSNPKDFITFCMHRAKIMGQSKTIGADDGVIISFPFQALLSDIDATDVSTLVIQKS